MRPVFALDLDGTLVSYHEHFAAFATGYFGKSFPHISTYDARVPFYRWMGVSKERYRRCKLAYRKGELKRSVPLLTPPLPQAPALTRTLRKWGGEVWLCTTRPYLAYDMVDDATRENLRRHGVQYDHIIWGEKKYHDLRRAVGQERVVAVLEDDPKLCEQAYGLGLPTVFAKRQHNARQYEGLPSLFKRDWHWAEFEEETEELLRKLFDEWKGRR